MEFYGKATLEKRANRWEISALPDVIIELKRIFPRTAQEKVGIVTLKNTDEICRKLLWFSDLYPLEFSDLERVQTQAKAHKAHIEYLQVLVAGKCTKTYQLALPLREYQNKAVELFLAQGHLLLADEMGTGKSPTAIGALSQKELRPAVIVCQAHLCIQWTEFFKKFLPSVKTEIAKTSKPHTLDAETEVLVISYNKLSSWVDHLGTNPPKSLIFDEVQELRRPDSKKYKAAKMLRKTCQFVQGLSGTPVINYGGEIYHIFQIIAPGKLGSESEFKREWCSSISGKWIVKDPEALGSYLRREFLLLRRTRKDIKSQLPPLSTSIHKVPFQVNILKDVETASLELAKIILEGSFTQQGQASRELDMRMRQATGIAKAVYVAEFARMLLIEKTPIILCGWHRTVYDMWLDLLKEFNPVMFTGSESPAEKNKAKQQFLDGETNLFIMSLRSGAGLDGLQHRCSTVIFGEIDWSRAIHEQVIFRLLREGQLDPVQAFYLLADGGSDPIVSQILGIKAEQADGIIDLFKKDESGAEPDLSRIKVLAKHLLDSHGRSHKVAEPKKTENR